MVNRINEVRKQIRALRVIMFEAEAIVREQVNRDLDCSFVADEMLKMRVVMGLLAEERTRLGDREPILVNFAFIPRRASAQRASRIVKRHLVPAENRAR